MARTLLGRFEGRCGRFGVDVMTIKRAPAVIDLVQGVSGLLLGLFMWAHMLFVSSILISNDAMYLVARAFEGMPFLSEPEPMLVSAAVAAIAFLFALHALAALRRIPAGWSEQNILWTHARRFNHPDTWLWIIQVITGMLILVIAPVHLYGMFMHPADIGPYASSDRFVSGGMWPLYLALLFAVELHGGIGLYRVVIKWGWWPASGDIRVARKRLKTLKWLLTAFFLTLGLSTFAAYVKIGLEHAPFAGERYVPTWVEQGGR